MKVESTIDVYEYDGSATKIGDSRTLMIHAHWIYQNQVVIELGGHKYTVVARDLKMAIQNATNHD
ncbi:hypothetical protein LCGC14_1143430 [marine sediment metagenome]|uniref:Uncharacterized protein n=1 Tax=marine sediment metagenome TaxID=412755 RepID=A0A0F9PFR1_9ZZZZ